MRHGCVGPVPRVKVSRAAGSGNAVHCACAWCVAKASSTSVSLSFTGGGALHLFELGSTRVHCCTTAIEQLPQCLEPGRLPVSVVCLGLIVNVIVLEGARTPVGRQAGIILICYVAYHRAILH